MTQKVDKQKRLKMVRSYINKVKEPFTQKDIVAILQNEGIQVSQATISRDLEELGCEKAGNGIYVEKKSVRITRQKEILSRFFENDDVKVYGPYLLPRVYKDREVGSDSITDSEDGCRYNC